MTRLSRIASFIALAAVLCAGCSTDTPKRKRKKRKVEEVSQKSIAKKRKEAEVFEKKRTALKAVRRAYRDYHQAYKTEIMVANSAWGTAAAKVAQLQGSNANSGQIAQAKAQAARAKQRVDRLKHLHKTSIRKTKDLAKSVKYFKTLGARARRSDKKFLNMKNPYVRRVVFLGKPKSASLDTKKYEYIFAYIRPTRAPSEKYYVCITTRGKIILAGSVDTRYNRVSKKQLKPRP